MCPCPGACGSALSPLLGAFPWASECLISVQEGQKGAEWGAGTAAGMCGVQAKCDSLVVIF